MQTLPKLMLEASIGYLLLKHCTYIWG